MDADTKVMPKSLTYMVAAMVNDITIMGLCGETRIANKRESCKYNTPSEALHEVTIALLFFF